MKNIYLNKWLFAIYHLFNKIEDIIEINLSVYLSSISEPKFESQNKIMKKLKIAMVFDGLSVGGVERVGSDYAKILDSMGHQVTIINLNPKNKDMLNEFPTSCSVINYRYPRKFVPEQYSQLTKKGVIGTTLYLSVQIPLHFLSTLMKVKYRIQAHDKYDLVISFSGHFNDLNFNARNFTKSNKKICWLHGALYSYLLISNGYAELYKKIKNLVVLVSDAQEEALMYNNHLNLHINKLYNPTFIDKKVVSTHEVNLLREKYGDFLLMVSRFSYPHKDQISVAKMYRILREKYNSDLDLVFVGDGPDEVFVKELVNKFPHHIQSHIHFEGSRSNVQDYYKAAKILVHSSVAGEGLPTVMLEALSYNLPMVVTDSKTGPREIIGENEYGLLCRVQDPDDMAAKVDLLNRNAKLYEQFKNKSPIRLRDFTPIAIREQLNEILEEMFRMENKNEDHNMC